MDEWRRDQARIIQADVALTDACAASLTRALGSVPDDLAHGSIRLEGLHGATKFMVNPHGHEPTTYVAQDPHAVRGAADPCGRSPLAPVLAGMVVALVATAWWRFFT